MDRNRDHTDNKFTALKEYLMCTALRKDTTSAANCVECGLCEKHCPQGIKIRQELKHARKYLEGPVYQIAKRIIPLVIKY